MASYWKLADLTSIWREFEIELKSTIAPVIV